MLLTITNTRKPATDLSFLLHKHPNRVQTFDLAFGKAHVFYSIANDEICTANLLLDVDTIGLVRRKDKQTFALEQYVNDRPFVASSFFSVAIASVFRSALNGKCDAKQDVADSKLPLVAEISALQCKQGEVFLRELFEPLGYYVEITQHILDERFTDWGASDYFTIKLSAEIRLADLLSHLYVLIPVLDNKKHYFIDEAEVEKLLRHGEKWLANHPQREAITQRYLKRKNSLIREALSRLIVEENETENEFPQQLDEEILEKPILLNEKRYIAVLKELQTIGAKRVVDVGCGEGRLLKAMFETKNFDEIVGLDVSHRTLEIASERLKIEHLPVHQQDKIKLILGSLTYKDARISNFDAA
ncbi:MAG: 3' terminal RNA ribose 2'-O-methyltransferase Hen1, partial [Pyrinomonadaceae bacterium]|nr:3' terminal RNA ribose 2'-O-methyltransferase Hen1 [Pyrinomonadaceae bacterium]